MEYLPYNYIIYHKSKPNLRKIWPFFHGSSFNSIFFLTSCFLTKKKQATLPRNSLLHIARGNFALAEVLHRPVRSPRRAGGATYQRLGPAINGGPLRPRTKWPETTGVTKRVRFITPKHLITGDVWPTTCRTWKNVQPPSTHQSPRT